MTDDKGNDFFVAFLEAFCGVLLAGLLVCLLVLLGYGTYWLLVSHISGGHC